MPKDWKQAVLAGIGARMASSVGNKLLSFVVFAYAGRRLGPELFGAYAFGVAINAFAILLADLGVLQVLIRRLARQWDLHGKRALLAALMAKLVLCLCAASIGWGYAVLTTRATGLRLLVFGAVVLGSVQGVADTAAGAYVATGRQVRVAWAEFLNRSVWAVVSIGSLTLLRGDLAAAGMGCGLVLGVGAQLLALRGLAWPWPPARGLLGEFTGLVREGRPLLLQALATTIYLRIDLLILVPLIGQAAVGQYAAAVRLAEPPVIIPGILASVLFPALVRAHYPNGGTEPPQLLVLSAELVYWAVVGVALVLSLGSAELLGFVYGPDFAGAGGALRWLAFALIPLSTNVLVQQALVARGGERISLRLALISAAVNVMALYVLVPAQRVTGAGLASFMAYSAFVIFGLFIGLSRRVVVATIAAMKRPLIIAIVAAGAALVATRPVVRLAVGAAVYLIGAVLLGRPVRRLVRPLEEAWASVVLQRETDTALLSSESILPQSGPGDIMVR